MGVERSSGGSTRKLAQRLARDVSNRFKLGQFDDNLFKLTERLGGATESVELGDAFGLKCRSLVCEVRDWTGRTREAQEAVKQGGELWDSIQSPPTSRDPAAMNLARERVRFVADYARVFFYRDRKYEL